MNIIAASVLDSQTEFSVLLSYEELKTEEREQEQEGEIKDEGVFLVVSHG
jgi:hypothetical protein